jgi:hypothetical protein
LNSKPYGLCSPDLSGDRQSIQHSGIFAFKKIENTGVMRVLLQMKEIIVKAAVVQWSHTGIAGSISSVELFLIGDIR